MSLPPPVSAEDAINQPLRTQLEVFLDEHRSDLNHCLDGLTEEQARRSLVRSRTTLLGLVKHTTFVEKVWFDEGVTGRSRAEIGIPATPDESFILHDDDTIASVRHAHIDACQASRRAAASLGLDDLIHGNRRPAAPPLGVSPHAARASPALRPRRHPPRADPQLLARVLSFLTDATERAPGNGHDGGQGD